MKITAKSFTFYHLGILAISNNYNIKSIKTCFEYVIVITWISVGHLIIKHPEAVQCVQVLLQ